MFDITQRLFDIMTGALVWPGKERAAEIKKQADVIMSEHGDGQWDAIKAISMSETTEQRDYRKQIHTAVTAPVVELNAQIIQIIPRAAGRVVRLEVTSTAAKADKENLQAKIDNFHRRAPLYEFLFGKMKWANLNDPNAYLLIERTEEDGQQVIYPNIISSEDICWVGNAKSGNLSALAFTESVAMDKAKGGTETVIKYYYYSANQAVEAFETKEGIPLPDGFQTHAITDKGKRRVIFYREYETNLGVMPAVSLGAFMDKKDHDTYCLYYQEAVSLLFRMIKLSNMLSVEEAVNVFEETYRYYVPCSHQDDELGECQNGYYQGMTGALSHRCKSCHGTGRAKQGSQMSEMGLRLPSDPADMIDLNKLVHKYRPGMDAATYLAKAITELEDRIMAIVFKMQPGQAATATEILRDQTLVTNAIQPLAKTVENIFEHAVLVIGAYLQIRKEDIDVSIQHDSLFRVVNAEQLIAEYGLAQEKALPSTVLLPMLSSLGQALHPYDTIDAANIAAIEANKPFFGKFPADVMMILQDRANTDYDKQLVQNWHTISHRVLEEHPTFSEYPKKRQRDAIKAIADEIFEGITYQANPTTGDLPFEL